MIPTVRVVLARVPSSEVGECVPDIVVCEMVNYKKKKAKQSRLMKQSGRSRCEELSGTVENILKIIKKSVELVVTWRRVGETGLTARTSTFSRFATTNSI